MSSLTQSASLTVTAPVLIALRVAPATVVGGGPSVGTVTLNGLAPTSGTAITLSTSNMAVVVPASVTVLAGNISQTFPITTQPVANKMQSSISATLGTTTLYAPLTIIGATKLRLKVNPTPVVVGNASQATVTLSSPAPAGGSVVSLFSDSTAAEVVVPVQVTVAVGTKTATFPTSTPAVGATLIATISASTAAASASAPLIVTPALTGLTLNPASVPGGIYSTGIVTLSSPAPTTGLYIALGSDNASATVSALVVVAAGATSGTFPISTSPIAASTTANISAALGGITRSAPLSITAAASVLTSIVVTPGNAVVQTEASNSRRLHTPAERGLVRAAGVHLVSGHRSG